VVFFKLLSCVKVILFLQQCLFETYVGKNINFNFNYKLNTRKKNVLLSAIIIIIDVFKKIIVFFLIHFVQKNHFQK